MILAELKNYVEQRGQISLRDAALHFDAEPEAIRGMLEFWVSKGRISKHGPVGTCAGGCACGATEQGEIYVWNRQLGQIAIEVR